MYTLYGHANSITCLSTQENSSILLSGSLDMSIKLWDMKRNNIIYNLSHIREDVIALCGVIDGVLVSAYGNRSLVVWEYDLFGGISSTSTNRPPRHVLTGHTSDIFGSIRISNIEIISGESKGNLRIWNIIEGTCTKHIYNTQHIHGNLWQIKLFGEGEVAVSGSKVVAVWGDVNNWEVPYKVFNGGFINIGLSTVEILSKELFVRGGRTGDIEIVDYTQTQTQTQRITVIKVHSDCINDLLRISKNIVVSASENEILKAIDVVYKKCYFIFQNKNETALCALAKINYSI